MRNLPISFSHANLANYAKGCVAKDSQLSALPSAYSRMASTSDSKCFSRNSRDSREAKTAWNSNIFIMRFP